MKNFFLTVNLFLVVSLQAQTWTNLNFNENQPGLENNPLKGFADLYGPNNNFPRSINGKLFGLNQVMNGLNDFNWTVVDNFITQNKNEGNFSYIQVNIDPGPNSQNIPQSYMPAFLNGQYNSVTVNGPVADICPDWNDPQVIEARLNFIAAFGAKYNNKPEVFMVHLGLYGIYGEWQIGDAANIAPDFEMTQANKTLIANAYKAAFPNKYLLARYPENMPNAEDFGYSDGLFFTQSISNNTFFNHFYFDNTIKLYNAGQNWKTQIIGGEIDPCVQPSIWQNWPNSNSINCNPTNPSGQNVAVQDVQQTLAALHPTFLFSHHIFTALNQTTNLQEWNNAILAQKKMGYTFYLNKYRLSATNGFPTIEANIQNTGIAPMYANWEVEFGVINTNTNQFQSLGTKKWNLNIIQPSIVDNYRSFASTTSLADGTYQFLIKIVNPLEVFGSNADPVRFANDTQDANNKIGWLTLGQATITSGTLAIAPVKVSGITVTPSSVNITVGNTFQLTSVVSPANATNQEITWVSSKPGTASVNANGLVTAGLNYGPVTISAYTNDGGFLGESQITVQPFSVVVPAILEAENYVRMNGIIPGFGKLGFIDNRDWMDYNITVNTAANYFIDLYASCPSCNDDLTQVQNVGRINIKDQNGVLLNAVRLPNTNSFDSFEIASSASIPLPSGTYNIRIEADKGGFDIDKIAFRLDTSLGLDSFENFNSIKIYPNPSNNIFNFQTIENIENIKVYNLLGQEVFSKEINSKDFTIDVSHLPNGTYEAKLSVNGKSKSVKLIKL